MDEVVAPTSNTPKPKRSLKVPLLMFLCLILVASNVFLLYSRFNLPESENKHMSDTEVTSQATFTLPKDAIKISGCIPHEGEHWVQAANLPQGPFYVAYEGKVIAIEYMFTEEDIQGKDFAHKQFPEVVEHMQKENVTLSDLVHDLEKLHFVLPDVKVKSWSMHWTAPHAGFASPHYDVHLYLVDRSELENICPDSTLENVLPGSLLKDLLQKGIPVPGAGAPPPSDPQTTIQSPTATSSSN